MFLSLPLYLSGELLTFFLLYFSASTASGLMVVTATMDTEGDATRDQQFLSWSEKAVEKLVACCLIQ